MSEKNLIRLELYLMGRPVKKYTFDQDSINVGRDPKSDIFVDNPGVSREHLKFELTPSGEYRVVDMGSANGTLLNDEPVKRAYVWNQDVVRFGKYSLVIGLARDRREHSSAEQPRVSPTVDNATMVMSTDEIEHLLSVARQREAASPVPKVAAAAKLRMEVEKAGPGQSLVMPAPAPANPAAPRSVGAVEVWATILLGTALACAMGAGVTWLLTH